VKKLLAAFFLLTAPVFAQNDLQAGREQVRILLGEIAAERYSDPLIDTAYNRAIKEAALLAGVLIENEDTLTTAINVDRYALNADFWRLRSVWNGITQTRQPLTIVDNPYSTVSGLAMPSQYCFTSKNNLFIYGLTTGVLKIHVLYYARPKVLTLDSMQSDIPYLLRPSLPYLAASFLSYQEKRKEDAQVFYTRAVDLINAYRTYYGRQGDVPEVKKP